MFQVGDTIKRTYPSGNWKVMKIEEIGYDGDYSGTVLDANESRYIGKWWDFCCCQGRFANEIQLYTPSKHKQVRTDFLGGLNEFL
jgi:hypothetical protein